MSALRRSAGSALRFGQALKGGATSANDAKKRFWRGLDELAETQEYKDFLRHEYPYGAPHRMAQGGAVNEVNTLGRRDVLKLMAASAAFAGLTACTKLPTEKIVPYAQQAPEEFIPGKPLFYATAMPFGGVGTGLLVESHMGRPTKVEGNPGHPASLGRRRYLCASFCARPLRSGSLAGGRPQWENWKLERLPHGNG